VTACTANTWAGLPYLNRFYDGNTDGNGNCTTYVASNSFAALTINPGATVTCPDGAAANACMEADVTVNVGGAVAVNAGAAVDVSGGALYVAGRLAVGGTTASPVGIGNANAGAWGGIAFRPGSGGSLAHMTLSGAGASVTGSDGSTSYNAAILVENAAPTIAGSMVTASAGKGIEILAGAAPTLSDDTFAGIAAGQYAVQVDDLASLPTLSGDTFTGCTVQVSPDGVDRLSNLTFDPGQTVDVLGGALGKNDAWTDHGAPYRLEGDVTVPATATLTVRAPATLETAYGLYVGGALTMSGTATSPISLTTSNASPAPGQWGGIAFRPGSTGMLDHVHLSYAGGTLYTSDNTTAYQAQAGIVVDGASPTVSNSTIDDSNGQGLHVVGGNPTLTNDRFAGNGDWAVYYDYLPADFAGDSGLSASGNRYDAVGFPGGAIAGRWDTTGLGIPLDMNGDLHVNAGATLTLGAGSGLYTNNGVYVEGPSGQAAGGMLNAAGTATQPVSMTVLPGSQSQWGGIAFRPGSQGTLDHTHVSYAGGSLLGGDGSTSYQTSILVEGASPTISNSTIDNSAGKGVEILSGGTPTLSNDTFAAITVGQYAVQVDDLASLPTLSNDTFSGSTIQVSPDGIDRLSALHLDPGQTVDVLGGTLGKNDAWTDHGAPYRLEGDVTVPATVTLSVPSPATLRMGGSLYIAGTLAMTGTATSPVSLTSPRATPAAGDWGSIAFRPGSAGSLDHVHLSYGGGKPSCRSDQSYCGYSPASVLVEGASPTISDSTVDRSAGEGIEVFGSYGPRLAGDTFLGNADWAVYYDDFPLYYRDEDLRASGNGHDAVGFGGYRIDSVDASWDTSVARLPIVTNVRVGARATLSLAAGSTFYMATNEGGSYSGGIIVDGATGDGGYDAQHGGRLIANGTPGAPITFTSANSLPYRGQWQGLSFGQGASGVLSYVHISYAGANDPSVAVSGGSVSIANSTIDNSAGDDVRAYAYSSAYSSAQSSCILHNDVFGAVPAGFYAVENYSWYSGGGMRRVDATHNWWGDPSGPSGAGPGGVPVSAGVDYTPWFTNPRVPGGSVTHYLVTAHTPQATGRAWAETVTALNERGMTDTVDAAVLTVTAPLSDTGAPSQAQVFAGITATTPVTQVALRGGRATLYVRDAAPETIRLAVSDGTSTGVSAPIALLDATAPHTLPVPGTADLALAGQPDGTPSGGDTAPAQSPAVLPVLAGATIAVSAIGQVGSRYGGGNATVSDGPDATNERPTSIDGSYIPSLPNGTGISDIRAPALSLVGVFLSDGPPDSGVTPPVLEFLPQLGQSYSAYFGVVAGGTSYGVIAPRLQQTFFIGDGLTGDGSGHQQAIVVPPGATRLFLAPLTGAGSVGTGAYTATVRPASATPTLAGYRVTPELAHAAGDSWAAVVTAVDNLGDPDARDTSPLSLTALLAGTSTPSSHLGFATYGNDTTRQCAPAGTPGQYCTSGVTVTDGRGTLFAYDPVSETIQIRVTNPATPSLNSLSDPVKVWTPSRPAGPFYVSEPDNGALAKVTVDTSGAATVNHGFVTGLSSPQGVVFDHAGHLLVANANDGTIAVIDPTSGSVLTRTLNTTPIPNIFALAADPVGQYMWVTDGSTITRVSQATGETAQLPAVTVSGIHGLATNATGSRLFVTTDGGVVEVSLTDGHTVNALPLYSMDDRTACRSYGITYDGSTGHLFVGDTSCDVSIGSDTSPSLALVRNHGYVGGDSLASDGHGHILLLSPGRLDSLDLATDHVLPLTGDVTGNSRYVGGMAVASP